MGVGVGVGGDMHLDCAFVMCLYIYIFTYGDTLLLLLNDSKVELLDLFRNF